MKCRVYSKDNGIHELLFLSPALMKLGNIFLDNKENSSKNKQDPYPQPILYRLKCLFSKYLIVV